MYGLWLKAKIFVLNILEDILRNPEALIFTTVAVSVVSIFAGGISSDIMQRPYTWGWYVTWWKWLELAGLVLLFVFSRDWSDVKSAVRTWRIEAEQHLQKAKAQTIETQRKRLTAKAETTVEQFLLGRGVDALTAKQASEEVERVLR